MQHVNNSAYTNAVAQLSLALPEKAFRLMGILQDRWQHFAEDIYVPYDAKDMYHPEYDGYVRGRSIIAQIQPNPDTVD